VLHYISDSHNLQPLELSTVQLSFKDSRGLSTVKEDEGVSVLA
jgi:hypothetical protein